MIPQELPLIESLSVEQLVAQMIVVRACGHLFDHQITYPQWEAPSAKLRHWIGQLGIGGVILLGGSAAEIYLRTQQFQSWAEIPLFMAADIEEGVGQRFSGATWFPPPMALAEIAKTNLPKAIAYAEAMGATTASQALSIGINWLLGPVVDVNNNPNNPVINIRAFGEDAATVSHLSRAFLRGAKQHPILTAAKHFPGHGDTAVDSHLELPTLLHSRERLAEVELVPFQGAIAAGVDAVMTAHLRIPSWDQDYPATLSQAILTGKLRRELGFTGLIVTDALIMGGITNHYGAGVAAATAVQAGADILLMPPEPEEAIATVTKAVAAKKINRSRLEASVARIWHAKQKLEPTPPVSRMLTVLAEPVPAVEAILKDSLRTRGALPLSGNLDNQLVTLRNLIYVDDAIDCDFLSRQAPAITIPRKLGYHFQLIDRNTSRLLADPTPTATLVQLFIRGNPFRGSAGATTIVQEIVKRLLQNHELLALVIYGSPYLWDQCLEFLEPDIPSVFTYGQTPSSQAIALSTLFNKKS